MMIRVIMRRMKVLNVIMNMMMIITTILYICFSRSGPVDRAEYHRHGNEHG